MTFSIIIPVYNSAKYIQRCLDSIIAQDYTDYEIIVVDDGSNDNSYEVISNYIYTTGANLSRTGGGNSLIFNIIRQQNAGVSAARNKGLDNANGEWILFVDSDDYLEPNALSIYYSALSKTSSPLLVSGYNIVKQSRSFNVRFKEVDQKNIEKAVDILDYTYHNSIAFIWHKIYRRDIIEKNKIRFNTDFQFGEDSLFNIIYLSKIEDVYFINQKTYNYCDDNPNSLVKKSYPIESMLNLISQYINQLDLSSNRGVINYTIRLLFRTLQRLSGTIEQRHLSIIQPSISSVIPLIESQVNNNTIAILRSLSNSDSINCSIDEIRKYNKQDNFKHLYSDLIARFKDKFMS